MAASKIIGGAVQRYKELCEGAFEGAPPERRLHTQESTMCSISTTHSEMRKAKSAETQTSWVAKPAEA